MFRNFRIAHRLISTLIKLYTIVVLILFFCVADQALGHADILPTSPTILCLILLSPFGVSLFIRHCICPSKSGPFLILAQNASALIPLAVIALFAIALACLPGTYWYEGGKWVFLVPYGLCIACAATLVGQYPHIKALLPISALASNTFLAASVWYDTLYPGTFAPITNRAAGFPGNANFSALVAVLVCAGGLRFGSSTGPNLPVKKRFMSQYRHRGIAQILNLVLLFVTFATVCMTMSRSGAVNFLVLIAVFFFYRFVRSSSSLPQRLLEMGLIGATSIAAIGFVVALTQITSASGSSRLTRLLNSQQVDDGSAGTRLQAAAEAINLIESAPLLGHGTGFARTMSELPHNIYLQQWVNNGILGLVSYAAFLLCTLITFQRRGSRNGVALIAVAAVGGIFSHNILDQRPFLILLGILLGLSQGNQQARDIVWLPTPRHTSATLSVVPSLVSAVRESAR